MSYGSASAYRYASARHVHSSKTRMNRSDAQRAVHIGSFGEAISTPASQSEPRTRSMMLGALRVSGRHHYEAERALSNHLLCVERSRGFCFAAFHLRRGPDERNREGARGKSSSA